MLTWVQDLSHWFSQNQRAMPWREIASPYRIWISEMMLQQTQVDTVIPYFNRFMDRFSSVDILANADQQDVLKLWEGLGYYSRARNLHKAAKILVNDFDGIIPEGYETLQTLPGIGPYAAAAITSIAFNNPIPVVDGNVLRVFSRYWGIADDIRLPKVRNELFDRLQAPIKDACPSVFNQAIMELGALICKPKNPQCTICPIKNDCYALKQNKVAELPYKSKAKKVPHYHIGVGVIWKKDKLLIAKRKETQMLGGLWEFPGGKQNENEDIKTTIKREILEETNLNVDVEHEICQVNHAYSHFKITLHAYTCTVISGKEKAISSDEIKWITYDDIDQYPFPKANVKVLEALKQVQLSII